MISFDWIKKYTKTQIGSIVVSVIFIVWLIYKLTKSLPKDKKDEKIQNKKEKYIESNFDFLEENKAKQKQKKHVHKEDDSYKFEEDLLQIDKDLLQIKQALLYQKQIFLNIKSPVILHIDTNNPAQTEIFVKLTELFIRGIRSNISPELSKKFSKAFKDELPKLEDGKEFEIDKIGRLKTAPFLSVTLKTIDKK